MEGDFKVRHVALLSRFQITLQKRPNDRPSSYLARDFEKVEGRNLISTLQLTYVDHVPVKMVGGNVIAGFHPKKLGAPSPKNWRGIYVLASVALTALLLLLSRWSCHKSLRLVVPLRCCGVVVALLWHCCCVVVPSFRRCWCCDVVDVCLRNLGCLVY
jgi:hypothetical protein